MPPTIYIILNSVPSVIYRWSLIVFSTGNGYDHGLESLYSDRSGNPRDAFSNNINKCLFASWTKSTRSESAVLATDVECSDTSRYSQLCYGLHPSSKALFAVCYDRKTLIPAFTGHIVKPTKGKGRPASFRSDHGKYGNITNQVLLF